MSFQATPDAVSGLALIVGGVLGLCCGNLVSLTIMHYRVKRIEERLKMRAEDR